LFRLLGNARLGPGAAPQVPVVEEGNPVRVEIWSDVVCPWCYIGKRRFEAALERFEHRDAVEVEWKAFELDPTATSASAGQPSDPDRYASRLAEKYAVPVEKAREMLTSMTAAAAAEGLDFHFERAVSANTFQAHQIIHLAAAYGIQDAVKERLLRAYFTEGEAVGDPDVLVRLTAEAGLDADVVRSALEEQSQAVAVRAEQDEARALRISGVPFFVIDRRYGVSGAQPADALVQVLEQAWTEAHPLQMATGSDGVVCGPDGCAV
jgi:predicted DsbA family dithiol-disulfide isomerase